MQTTDEDGRLRRLPWNRGRPERGVPRGPGTARGGALKRPARKASIFVQAVKRARSTSEVGMRSTKHQLRSAEERGPGGVEPRRGREHGEGVLRTRRTAGARRGGAAGRGGCGGGGRRGGLGGGAPARGCRGGRSGRRPCAHGTGGWEGRGKKIR